MLTINELLYNRGLPKGAKIKFVRHRRASYAVHMSILLPKKFFRLASLSFGEGMRVRLYFTQFTFTDFTSLEFPPTMITKSPDSQSYFRSLL